MCLPTLILELIDPVKWATYILSQTCSRVCFFNVIFCFIFKTIKLNDLNNLMVFWRVLAYLQCSSLWIAWNYFSGNTNTTYLYRFSAVIDLAPCDASNGPVVLVERLNKGWLAAAWPQLRRSPVLVSWRPHASILAALTAPSSVATPWFQVVVVNFGLLLTLLSHYPHYDRVHDKAKGGGREKHKF